MLKMRQERAASIVAMVLPSDQVVSDGKELFTPPSSVKISEGIVARA